MTLLAQGVLVWFFWDTGEFAGLGKDHFALAGRKSQHQVS